MSKQKWKAGNMVYPLPAVMISCGNEAKPNIVTVAWTGTICTNPAMTYISLRKTRFSYALIEETGYFTINLTTKSLVRATDFCGVRSGRDYDKFKEMNLTPVYDEDTGCPMILESPVSVVCKVMEIKELGSHDMFIAQVLNVYVDDQFIDEKDKFHLNASDLIAYSHGAYFTLGEKQGTFGYSVMKPKTVKEKIKENSKDKGKRKEKSEHDVSKKTSKVAPKGDKKKKASKKVTKKAKKKK